MEVDIPMLTDEDIDSIVQNMNDKEPPRILMSSKEDNSVNEIEKPVQENPIINAQPTSAIDSKEIDALQKHVEESLLFLDHDKADVNDPVKVEQNMDWKPEKKVVWETAESIEKSEHETGVQDKIEENGKTSLEPSATQSLDDVDGNSILVNQANDAVNPEKMDEDIESNFQESTLILALENVKTPKISVEQVNVTETHQKMDEDVENNCNDLNPISSVEEKGALPVEHTLEETTIFDYVEENDKNGNLETEESILPADNIQTETEVLDNIDQNDNTGNFEILPVEHTQKEIEFPDNVENDSNINLEPSEKMVLPVLKEIEFSGNVGNDNNGNLELSKESILLIENTQKEIDISDNDNNRNSELSKESVLPIENTQNETEVSDNVKDTDSSRILDQSNVVDNINHKEDISEDIHNNMDANLNNENLLDSRLPEHQTIVKQDEPLTPIHETADKILLNSAQNKSNEDAEKMDETNDCNVQFEQQNATIQVVAESNPPSDHGQNEPNEDFEKNNGTVDKLSEAHKNKRESQVSEEIVKEPGDSYKNEGEIALKDVTGNPNLKEKVDESVPEQDKLESSQIEEKSVQENIISPSPSEGTKDIEETPGDNKTKGKIEPSQIENKKDENQIPTESNGKSATSKKDENIAPETQITSIESVFECPIARIKLEPNIEKMDVEDKPPKTLLAQTSIKQEIVDKKSQINKGNVDSNVILRQEIPIKQEKIESTAQVIKPKSTKIDSNIQTKSSNVSAKSKEVKASPNVKPPERINKKLVYNINSAHSGALIDVSKQTPKRSENVFVINPQSSNLIDIPLQNSTKVLVPPKDNNLSKNSNKCKVSNDAEYPPAKRSRVEPIWSTAPQNPKPLSTTSEETPSPVIHTWSLNESTKDTEGPESSDAPVLWETSGEANRPQSACSSILDETPMDLDDEDLHVPEVAPFSTAELKELTQWITTHRAIKKFQGEKHQRALRRMVKLNKAVVRLENIPKSFNQADVHLLLKKYTSDAGKEITKKISFIFMDKTTSSSLNTAYVKWRNEDKMLATKALLVMRRAELCLEGRRLLVNYDNRSLVDWDIEEKPILKNLKNDSPFITGEIQYKDAEAYGLHKEFLAKLNIELPLTNMVTVENVDNQLSETNLRRIFNKAGYVKLFIMNRKDDSLTLSIEYDHDLEAVQAISMFHQQMLYGRLLKVTMDKTGTSNTSNSWLPEGFTKIGPGLGFAGEPLQGVRAIMEIKRLKDSLRKDAMRLRQMLTSGKTKIKDALNKQIYLEKKIQQQNRMILNFKTTPKEAPVIRQNPQQTIAELSTAIASSIQTNLMSIMGGIGVPNIPPSVPKQVAPVTASPAWETSTDTPNWTQPTAQPNFTPNMQIQPHAYPQPGLGNLQTGPGTMPNPCAQQIPNLQAGPQLSPHLSMQTVPSMQPVAVNVQQEYIREYPVPSTMPNTQSVFPQGTPVPVTFPSAQVASNPVVYPPTPVTNPVTVASQSKFATHFDIPPPVIPPQNRGQINKKAPVLIQPPLPPSNPTEYILEIPLPKTKPQNRGPTKPIAVVKTAPLVKPPKPAGIKIKIASLQIPSTSKLDLDSIPPPPKPKPSTSPSKETYSKASKAVMRKSPIKEPWLNKQIKAMRRSSKSPESSRTHSPRYERSKENRRSRERNCSREKNGSRERNRSRERNCSRERNRSRERNCSRDRNYSRERDTDYKRTLFNTTVIFKYLPPSVKTDDLREKMREIGKLALVQLNKKGQALVKFRFRRDAETCVEMYNQAKVDGQTIEVKWQSRK